MWLCQDALLVSPRALSWLATHISKIAYTLLPLRLPIALQLPFNQPTIVYPHISVCSSLLRLLLHRKVARLEGSAWWLRIHHIKQSFLLIGFAHSQGRAGRDLIRRRLADDSIFFSFFFLLHLTVPCVCCVFWSASRRTHPSGSHVAEASS